MVRIEIVLLALFAFGAAASGCRGPERGVTTVGQPATLRPLRDGDRFAYAVRQGVGPLERGAANYVEMSVRRGVGNDLIVHYRRTRVNRPSRSRSERALHLPAREQTVDVKTADHRFTQAPDGTLRWQGPAGGAEPMQLRLIESCFAPEIRSPLKAGQTFDSGPTGIQDARTGQVTTTGRVRYVVKGVEKVRVPAGSFLAHRVEFELHSDLAGASRTWTDWYTAGEHLVKREMRTDAVKILGVATDYHESLERIDAVPEFKEYRRY